MKLSFHTQDILRTLSSLKCLQTPDNMTGALGPAKAVLHLFPSTSYLLRAIVNGLGDPLIHLKILQERVAAVEPLVQDLFPNDKAYEMDDLAAASFDKRIQITSPFHDVVLAAGHPEIHSEDVPILLGGLVTFAANGWAEILWDERSLVGGYNPFPMVAPFISPYTEGGEFLFFRELSPHSWKHARFLFDRLPTFPGMKRTDKSTIRLDSHHDYKNQRMHMIGAIKINESQKAISLSFARESEEGKHATQYKYSYDPSKKGILLKGVQIGQSSNSSESDLVRTIINGHSLFPDQPYQLDPNISQFFYFPGAAWEVTRYPLGIDELIYKEVAFLVRSCRDHLAGKTTLPENISRIEKIEEDYAAKFLITPTSPLRGPVWVQFNLFNEQGLSLSWRLELGVPKAVRLPTPEEKPRFDCMAVTEENAGSIQKYIEKKIAEERKISEAMRRAGKVPDFKN